MRSRRNNASVRKEIFSQHPEGDLEMVWVWIQGTPRQKTACPHRIAETTVHAIFFGLIGGAAFVFFSEVLNGNSLGVALQSAFRRAPAIAVVTCVVMAIYSTFECTVEFARNRDEAINCFIAGGLTGAVLGARGSAEAILINTVIFSLLFGILEGVL